MNIIKEKIYNTVKDWNKIIEKAGVEKYDEYESVELTVIIDDKHQISNLGYIFIFNRFLKKVKVILEKSPELINWTHNDFYFEISTLLFLSNYYQQFGNNKKNLEIVILDENKNPKHIFTKAPKTLYAQTTMPILIFNSNDLNKIKQSANNLFLAHENEIIYENYDDYPKKDINIEFINTWLIKCKENLEKHRFKEEIILYKNKFDVFTMMVFMYLIQKVKLNTIEQLNDLANEIKYFCSGIYQLIENSCFHSESKEAIFILSYLNFEVRDSNKMSNFLENNEMQYIKRLSYLKNCGFKLDSEYYASIRIIDDARVNSIKVKSLVEKATSNNNLISDESNLLLKFYNGRLSFLKNNNLFDDNEWGNIAEIAKKYGILMFLAVADTLEIQGLISSGKFSIYLDLADNIKCQDCIFNSKLDHNQFVTEYTYVVPLKPINRKIGSFTISNDISVLNVNEKFTVKSCSFDASKLVFADENGKVEAVRKLYGSLSQNFCKNNILLLEIDTTLNVEVVVKSIANFIYKERNFPIYIVLIFKGNIESNKLMIKDFIFFYRILGIKLKYLLNKKMISYNENDIQIILYSTDNIEKSKLSYVSTIVGIDNDVVIKSFVNNLLYNNEFSSNDFFDLYIDDVRLSNAKQNYKIEVLPVELFIKPDAQLFIDNLNEIINYNNIHHTNVNVLLGSGVHLRDFYEAEYIFQSKYLVSRLALLIKLNLKSALLSKFKNSVNEENTKIVIVGYASYSYLLGESLKEFINNDSELTKFDAQFFYFEHSNVKYDELDKLKISNKNNNTYYVALIPIASTLNTIFKMNKLLNYILLNNNNDFEFDMIYNIITVQPNKEYIEWIIRDDINTPFKTIEIEYEKDKKTKINTLLIKEGNYNNDVESLPVSKVDRTSTIQDSIYQIQPYSIRGNAEKNFKKFRFMIDAVKYGHYQLKSKHYLYYINYKKIFKKNEILRPLKSELEKFEINLLALNIVISPLSGNNHKFLETVLNNVFSGNAILIQFNKDTTYRENFLHKYSHIKDKIERIMRSSTTSVVNFYYVDTSIISGKTFNRAKELANVLIKDLKEEVKQRIPFRIFDKTFLFINRSSNNTLETLMDDEKNVYRFININCPSFEMSGLTCPDCKITENYLKLSSILSYSKDSQRWLEKAEKHKAIIINNNSDLDYNKKDFIRLCFTHLLLERRSDFQKIYDRLLENTLDETKCFDEIEDMKFELISQIKKIESSLTSSDYDELFIRVISRPFLTTYECIKQISFIYLKQLLSNKLGQFSENTLIFIINRISYYGSNYLNIVLDREKFLINKSDEFKNCFERALIFERACARGIIK